MMAQADKPKLPVGERLHYTYVAPTVERP